VALVEQVVRLVKAGWQVLYLTMDDHLRGLFEVQGRAALGAQFKLVKLGET
jgi:hypothetical protein